MLTKLPNWIKIDKSWWVWKGQVSGGVEEIRDVLLSGAVVVVAVCDMAKNPSFIHCQPDSSWIAAHPVTGKTRSCTDSVGF
jgi:hypothetical protein